MNQRTWEGDIGGANRKIRWKYVNMGLSHSEELYDVYRHCVYIGYFLVSM